jgi:hypothetical protein
MNYDRPVFSFFGILKIFLMSSPCWSPAWKFFLTSTQAHLSLDLCRLLSHGFSQKIPTLTQIPPLFGNKKCICRRDSQNHVAYTMQIGVLRHFGGYTKCQYIWSSASGNTAFIASILVSDNYFGLMPAHHFHKRLNSQINESVFSSSKKAHPDRTCYRWWISLKREAQMMSYSSILNKITKAVIVYLGPAIPLEEICHATIRIKLNFIEEG